MLIIWTNFFKYFAYILHFFTCVKSCTVHSLYPTLLQLNNIKFSLDQTVSPCDDFYAYACGEWPRLHPDPGYDEITGMLDYQMNKILINIIESAYQHPCVVKDQCQTFVQKARIYYKSCIGENTPNLTHYFEVIKPGPGLEWPLMELIQAQRSNVPHAAAKNWSPPQWNLFALLGTLQSYGFNNALIKHEIMRNDNGSLRIQLELPYASRDDELPKPLLIVLLQRLGLPEKKAMVFANNIRATQSHWHDKYANFSESAYKNNRIELSYRDLQQSYTSLFTYLDNVLPPQQRSDDDVVVIENLDYFENLLSKQWVPAQITNYLMLKFMTYLLKDATSGFTKLDCIKELRNKMDLAVNYLYYEQIYCKQSREYDKDIALLEKNLKKYFWKTLEENNLQLDSRIVQQLQRKINALSINVGNLPTNRSCSQIQEFYSDVPALDKRNYYSNHMHLLRHRFLKSLLYAPHQSFFVATDNRVGSSSAPVYIVRQNMVLLHMGFLQPPVFDHTYPPILLWSLLGFVLAHEFTHAVDTTGLYYDTNGQMLPGEPEVFQSDRFIAALDCMQNQQVTSEIDERLADLVGARVAYKAFVHEMQYQLQPQFAKVSWKKLFFLNMAQFFCGREGVKFVEHDADKVRLQEIVKNSVAFAKAFQCPVGSPMNPEVKCRLY